MTPRVVGHQHPYSQESANMEVVVNVHAAQTTTSKPEAPRHYYNFYAEANDS
ncbi:MAG TPA: hypothetical protein VJ249_03490 [Candidatus Bathyarchaeia archaeon]|nr:hypothetical protein [Candidatus Bathyarchaeia archaeon]